jgi:hypothetical protein
MNLPVKINYNTNQIQNNILGSVDNKTQWTDSIKDSFYSNLDYRQIIKNANNTNKYDVLIYSGSGESARSTNSIETKMFLSYPYDTVKFDLGDYINFDLSDGVNSNWIITEINKLQLYDINGKIERCNNTLSFQLENGSIVTYPCILDFNNGSLQYLDKGLLTIINSDAILKIQYNENTKQLTSGNRIMLSNGEVYKIEDINTKYIYNVQYGFIIFYLERNVVNTTSDDLINKVADRTELVTSTGNATISYTGLCEVRVGGGYKTFFASIPNEDTPIWSFISSIGGESNISTDIDNTSNSIRIKVNKISTMIGSTITLNVTESTGTYSGSIVIPVISLV